MVTPARAAACTRFMRSLPMSTGLSLTMTTAMKFLVSVYVSRTRRRRACTLLFLCLGRCRERRVVHGPHGAVGHQDDASANRIGRFVGDDGLGGIGGGLRPPDETGV